MTIKRLCLPSWTSFDISEYSKEERLLGSSKYPKTFTTINKEGWYYSTLARYSWFEIQINNKIEAFKTDNEDFIYELKINSHKPLTEEEYQAGIVLLRYQKNSQLKELISTDTEWKYLREIIRNSSKWKLRFKEFKNSIRDKI